MFNFSTYTEQLLEEYKIKMDQVLLIKFMQLKRKALEHGEYHLYDALNDIDMHNIEKTKIALEKQGYTLELEQPQPEFSSEENIFKATIQTDSIKLRVRKTIFEV